MASVGRTLLKAPFVGNTGLSPEDQKAGKDINKFAMGAGKAYTEGLLGGQVAGAAEEVGVKMLPRAAAWAAENPWKAKIAMSGAVNAARHIPVVGKYIPSGAELFPLLMGGGSSGGSKGAAAAEETFDGAPDATGENKPFAGGADEPPSPQQMSVERAKAAEKTQVMPGQKAAMAQNAKYDAGKVPPAPGTTMTPVSAPVEPKPGVPVSVPETVAKPGVPVSVPETVAKPGVMSSTTPGTITAPGAEASTVARNKGNLIMTPGQDAAESQTQRMAAIGAEKRGRMFAAGMKPDPAKATIRGVGPSSEIEDYSGPRTAEDEERIAGAAADRRVNSEPYTGEDRRGMKLMGAADLDSAASAPGTHDLGPFTAKDKATIMRDESMPKQKVEGEARDSFHRAVGRNVTVDTPELDKLLEHAGVDLKGKVSFLGGGNDHSVFDLGGNKVAKIGYGEIPEVPKIDEVLQPTKQTHVSGPASEARGGVHQSIYPKADTSDITPKDITAMTEKLKAKGYTWDDANGNLGRVNGELKVIDAGGVKPIQ
jgi:hypothetical protein